MRKILLYGLILFLFACKKEIYVNIEDRPASLVVNAQLEPDSLISINLSLTQNIIDLSEPKKVNDAVIEVLSKDSTILDVLQVKGKGLYQSAVLKPKTSTQYLFRISQQNKVYWINEQMPDSFKANLIDTIRGVFQGQANFFQMRLNVSNDFFHDNFFGLRIKRLSRKIQGNDTVLIEEWSDIETADLILTEDAETHFSKKHLLFSDRYFKGLQQELKFGTSINDKPNQKTLSLSVYVSSYSLNAYNYYTSLNEHLFYQNDPFSQPTVLKGNVVNAYGAAVGQIHQVFLIQF